MSLGDNLIKSRIYFLLSEPKIPFTSNAPAKFIILSYPSLKLTLSSK